jgi:transcriptional regulator with XRE-family HTH domain
MQAYPAVLKTLRKQKKLTQQDVADILCISQRTYSHYETGRTEPNIESLLKLSDIFNVPVDVIVGKYELKKST